MAISIASSLVYILANASLHYPAVPLNQAISQIDNGTTVVFHNNLPYDSDNAVTNPPQIYETPRITTLYGTREYYFEYTPEVNWHEADSLCRKKGMQLPSAYGIEEYNLIKQEVYKRGLGDTTLWLSGNNIDSKNQFSWYPKEKLITLDRWGPGFPSSDRNNCIYMSEGSWKHEDCDGENRFFCEKYL